MYSARKPYLKLKASIADFYKTRILFMKELNAKFSEFEKPYLDQQYTQMHLDFQDFDWGPWEPPLRAPLGPFPRNPWELNVDCVINCWHVWSCTDILRCYLAAWGGAKSAGTWDVQGDVLAWREVDTITADIHIQFDTSTDSATVVVGFEDEHGGICFNSESVKCRCEGATILYTTLGMKINESQSLSASPAGQDYEWKIESGGGILSQKKGSYTTYTAPSENPNCDSSPTIELYCLGGLMDTIDIAITELEGGYNAYNKCCNITSPDGYCWGYYSCDDSILSSGAGPCPGGWVSSCADQCGYNCVIHEFGSSCSGEFPNDNRSAGLKAAGCCPSAL